MKAIILCGGKGTRIRDVSDLMPKPMLPIGGRPVLWHIMKMYAAFGINEFVLSVGYKGWMIKEFFLQYHASVSDVTIHLGAPDKVIFQNKIEESEWKVTIADTGEEAQTGARVWKARQYLDDTEKFCMTYGDGVANINVEALLQAHEKNSTAGTLSGVRPAGRFGEMELSGNAITSFNEKPNAVDGYINGGFMVFNTDQALPFFREGDDLILEQEVLPKMVKSGQLGVYRHDGFWQCMDTLREYTLLNDMWKSGQPPWKVW